MPKPRCQIPPSDIRLMVKDITDERRFKKLSEWEQSFIATVDEISNAEKFISEKQYSILSKIYDKATEDG